MNVSVWADLEYRPRNRPPGAPAALRHLSLFPSERAPSAKRDAHRIGHLGHFAWTVQCDTVSKSL